MKKRILSSALVVAMASAMLVTGCKGGKEESNTPGGSKQENVQTYQEKSGKKGDVTVSWWVMGGTDEYYQDYWTEMKGLKKIQETVGVNIDFQVASSYDVYLPMMTARNYPDVITAKNLEQYSGRLAAMYKDGVSLKLNDLMEDGWMPNFSKIVEKYPNIARDLKLDDGSYTFLSTLYDIEDEKDRAAASQYGLAIRQDWLDEVGMDIPTTIDEWYETLLAFKKYDPNGNGEADEEPVCMASSGWKYFLAAYGIDDDPCVVKQDDGTEKVVYGFVTDAYKEYLTEMAKWYKEGLIYNMFEQTSLEARQERVTSNLAGAWKGDAAHFDLSDPNSYISVLRKTAPNAEFAACPWPLTADGYQWCFSDIASFDRDTTVITSKAKDDGVVEAAAYLIDYMLSEEGSTLLTWGIEGESYEVKNGEKQLKKGMNDMVDFHGAKIQKINTYADPLTVMFPQFGEMSNYVLKNEDEGYVEACKTWAEGDTNYKLSAACQLSVDQQAKVDSVTEGMKGYITKMRARFIQGGANLTDFDSYVSQVKTMGADQYAEIWQEAYDAYKSR